ncbi:hypothetical protein P9112_002866 [Eukaryota sp. TZLM1-RC]
MQVIPASLETRSSELKPFSVNVNDSLLSFYSNGSSVFLCSSFLSKSLGSWLSTSGICCSKGHLEALTLFNPSILLLSFTTPFLFEDIPLPSTLLCKQALDNANFVVKTDNSFEIDIEKAKQFTSHLLNRLESIDKNNAKDILEIFINKKYL